MKKLGCGALILSTMYSGGDRGFEKQLPTQPSILLFQRGYGAPSYPGCLGGPGGLYEEEDIMATHTVAREAKEESNIDFIPLPTPFYEGSMEDRDLRYYLGTWRSLSGGIHHVDGEAIGHIWLSAEKALLMDLSFQYRQAIEKLVAEAHL